MHEDDEYGRGSVQLGRLESADEIREGFALFRQAHSAINDIERGAPDSLRRYLDGSWMIGARENGQLLGIVNGYDADITLPGNACVKHLSVTHVGVSAAATRKGIARRLLTQQLRLAREAGYVVAGLRATSAKLYGRYGYGVASLSVRQELDLSRTDLAVPTGHTQVRHVDPLASFDLLRRIAANQPDARSASLSRWDGWWAMQEFRALHANVPQHTVVFGTEGVERGFMRFHSQPNEQWLRSNQRGVVVDDLVAHDDEAWRALIGYLFAKDILHRAVFPSRPQDDPLPLLLSDPRALEVSAVQDESWIRPLNLQELLSRRSYGEAPAVVVAVDDELFPDQAGPWQIAPKEIRRTQAAADARIAVADLASLIFGAQSARNLAAAQRLHGASAQTIEALDRLFAVHQKPHSGIFF